jgi:hypothetical protein
MRVYSDEENPVIVCKWCDHDMEPKENHKKNCFASRVLGRPSEMNMGK